MTTTRRDQLTVSLIIAVAVLALLALLALPARAQCDATCSPAPEPPIGTACTSLHPWSCDSHQLYLPEVSR